jgi:DNA-binding SARP family transcriptional activator
MSPLATTSNGYLLCPSAVSVDLAEFRRLVGLAASASPEDGLRLAQQAVAMLSGEVLASEAYAAWACSERKVFQREVVEACGRAALNALAIRDLDAAVCMSRLAISYDSLAEDASQHLMRALMASGRGSEAIRAYFDLRTVMISDLGMEPGPVTRALYLEILCADSAPATSEAGGERADLKRRLGFLHQALEAITGVRLPALEGPLAEMAVHAFANSPMTEAHQPA